MGGLLVGTCVWFASLLELPAGFEAYTGAPTSVAWLGVAGLSVYNALPFALFGYFWGKATFSRQGMIGLFQGGIHCLGGGAVLALGMSLLPSPLPVTVAHALYADPVYLQLLEYGGIPLLTFAVVLVNALVADAWCGHKANLIVAALIVVVLFGYGTRRMAEVDERPGALLTAGIVSPNVEPMEVSQEEGLRMLVNHSKSVLRSNPDIAVVVWPEVPFPIVDPGGKGSVTAFSSVVGRDLVFQYMGRRGDRLTNSAQYALTDGTVGGRYDKRVLVPFAEYLPLENMLPFLRCLLPRIPNFAAGNVVKVFQVSSRIGIQPLICYEVTDSSSVRDGQQSGATILANLTNDAWLAGTTKSVHLALSVMRSVEYRLPILRAANGGFSCAVSASGRIMKIKGPGQAAATAVTIKAGNLRTFYAQHPYSVVSFIIFGAVVWALYVQCRRISL